MRKFNIWFNDKYLKRVKKTDFVKSHKHLALTDDQLNEVWEAANPEKKASVAEAPEKTK